MFDVTEIGFMKPWTCSWPCVLNKWQEIYRFRFSAFLFPLRAIWTPNWKPIFCDACWHFVINWTSVLCISTLYAWETLYEPAGFQLEQKNKQIAAVIHPRDATLRGMITRELEFCMHFIVCEYQQRGWSLFPFPLCYTGCV